MAPGSGFSPQVAGISELGQNLSVAAFGNSPGQPGSFSTASGENPFATDGVKLQRLIQECLQSVRRGHVWRPVQDERLEQPLRCLPFRQI